MWAWLFFSIYAVATALLAWRSSSATSDGESFAIGNGRMNPWMAGITLGACLASSSTFAIVPGFVYAEGLPALLGFTLPFIAGIAIGLFSMAYRFQVVGDEVGALTVPHWLGARYESDVLRRVFAGLNVLNIAYLVLITVGCAYIMRDALGIPYEASVVGIVLFVFAYTGLGGAVAHAWTNSLQGVVMLVIAVVIFLSGAHLWNQVGPDLLSTGLTRDGSVLFSTHYEVWLVQIVMGFALTTQPHLLSKALYVDGPRELTKTLCTAVLTFSVFSLVLFAGAYGRLVLPEGVAQDAMMGQYLQVAFGSPVLSAIVSVAILAAAMSTLDGLLVAIAASVGNDVFPGAGSVWLNRVVLVVLAVLTIGISINPPSLVLLVGQLGVYGLVAASAGPLLAGLFLRGRLPAWAAIASTVLSLVSYAALNVLQGNPGVAAVGAMAIAIPAAFAPTLAGLSTRSGSEDATRLPEYAVDPTPAR
jgi:SSS family solute:Na+ symporter/sodium/pantothenate symporter